MRTACCANCAHYFSNLFTHSTNALSTRIARALHTHTHTHKSTSTLTPHRSSRAASAAGAPSRAEVLAVTLELRPAEPLGGPGRPPPASPSSPSLQPAETSGNIRCSRVHHVGTRVPEQQRRLERRGTLFCYRVHYQGKRVPGRQRRRGTLFVTGYIIRVHVYPDDSDVQNVGEHRVHCPGTRVPGQQRRSERLERWGTAGTIRGYMCTPVPAHTRSWTYLCLLFALMIRFCFLLVFLLSICLGACLGCCSVCRVPLKTHTNTIVR